MPGIFTRPNVNEIIESDSLTPQEKTDKIMSLWGRGIDDGFVTKSAAKEAEKSAIEAAKAEWEKNPPKVNVAETPEYKALQSEFDGYKAKETARNSDTYKDVKPKFFDEVYGKVDRSEGAKPEAEQIAELKKNFEEFFNPADPEPKKPTFGGRTDGTMPKGDEGALAAMKKAWGIPTE